MEKTRVGIVGGGRAGLTFLEVLLTCEDTEVAYVCDSNGDAPALTKAREHNIAAITDLNQAVRAGADIVLEVTGSEKVLGILRQKLPEGVRLVDSALSRFFFTSMASHQHVVNAGLVAEMTAMRESILQGTKGILGLVSDIENLTSRLHMIGLNASVEAARIGDEGQAFAIVAKAVQEAARDVRETSTRVSDASGSIQGVVERISHAIERLES